MIEVEVNLPGLETDKILIKPMNLNNLVVSLDRLTALKYPVQRKQRVYKEILLKHLSSPKISSKNIYTYTQGVIESLAAAVWNISVKKLGENTPENSLLNLYLAYEDSKTYSPYSMIKYYSLY